MINGQRETAISFYKHISVIYNPYAGGLRGARIERLARAERALKEHAEKVTKHATSGPRTAGVTAQTCLKDGADLIVAAGGDGTINEVVEGMAGCTKPLAILPAGTANVLANEIKIGGSMERAARSIPSCIAKRVPLGKLELEHDTHHFLLMAGIGLDAHIVLNLDPGLKARLGKGAYWAAGMKEFGRRLEEFDVELNGEKHACSFALISKVRNYGGDFEIAREVTLMDDEFEVVLFEGRNPFRYVLYLSGVAAKQVRKVPGVHVYRAHDVRLAPRNGDLVHLQMDGEYVGRLPARVSISPDSVTLLVPPSYGS